MSDNILMKEIELLVLEKWQIEYEEVSQLIALSDFFHQSRFQMQEEN